MPFHIFIQTIFKLQLPYKSLCHYSVLSLKSGPAGLWWQSKCLKPFLTFISQHHTLSPTHCGSIASNNSSIAPQLFSVFRETILREILSSNLCVLSFVTLYCEKYSSVQLRWLSVCVKQLLTNDNNPSCCIIGKKVTKPLQTEVLLEQQSSQSQNSSSWEIPTSNTSLCYLCLWVHSKLWEKTFLGFTFLKDPIKVVKLWSGWYKRGNQI